MPDVIRLVSEPLPDEGGQIGVDRPLRGGLGLASLLVRETVQNSYDARDPKRGSDSVRYSLQGRVLQQQSLEALRRALPFPEGAEQIGGFPAIGEQDEDAVVPRVAPETYLANPARRTLEVLVVSDRNTVGLCGPTRANEAWLDKRRLGEPWEDAVPRFAMFIRNTGRSEAHIGRGDGGSFGVGKTILWRASLCGTILVHTRTTDEAGDPVDRVIGVVHGGDFTRHGLRYSGRHFIGVQPSADDTYVEPVTGAAARKIADELDLPAYGEGFGTSIVIVAPRREDTLEAAMHRIRDAARWQVWPKFARGIRPDNDQPDMVFSVEYGGAPIHIPDPDEDSELQPYVGALRDALHGQGEPVVEGEPQLDYEVMCRNPERHLGWLRIREALGAGGWQTTRVPDDDEAEDPRPFADPHGHVALIRREPLLLVNYKSLPALPGDLRYAGVYLSADDLEVEAALTLAEPQAHHEWRPEDVEHTSRKDWRRTYVRMTVEGIKAGVKSFRLGFSIGSVSRPTKQVAIRLGRGVGGRGGGKRPPGPTKKPPRPPVKSGPSTHLGLARSHTQQDVTLHTIEVRVSNVAEGQRVRLIPAVSGRDSAGSVDVADYVTSTWRLGPGGDVQGDSAIVTAPLSGPIGELVLEVRGELRIIPRITAELIVEEGE